MKSVAGPGRARVCGVRKRGPLSACVLLDAWPTRPACPTFVRAPRGAEGVALPKPAADAAGGGEKTALWRLRPGGAGLLRPPGPLGARPLLGRHAQLPGARGPARVVPERRGGEAGAAALGGRPAGGPPALGRVRRAPGPDRAAPRWRAGAAPGLAEGPGTGPPGPAGARAAGRDARTAGPGARRDCSSSGADIAPRSPGLGAPAGQRVWWHGARCSTRGGVL
jgi:hypothetical protein